MIDPHIVNPLINPILVPVLYRVLGVYAIGLLLILLLNKFNFKDIWSTNIGKRYLSWLVIGPVYILTILFGGDFSLMVLAVLLVFAIWEVATISKIAKPYVFSMYFLSIITVYVAGYKAEFFYTLPLLYFMVFSMVAIRENDAKKGLFHLSFSMLVSIWILFSLAHFVLLGHLNNGLDNTKSLLILIGFAVPLSDIFAYIVGRFFNKIDFLDKYKIASNLSPKKTYIGTLGNIIGAGLGIAIMYFAIGKYLPIYHWVIISILIGIMGVSGDIVESMFKRYFNVKDSSDLIPGHGGLLDRIDSTLRVIVVIYYYLLFFL